MRARQPATPRPEDQSGKICGVPGTAGDATGWPGSPTGVVNGIVNAWATTVFPLMTGSATIGPCTSAVVSKSTRCVA